MNDTDVPMQTTECIQGQGDVTGAPSIPFGMEFPVSVGIPSILTSMTLLLKISSASE